jgi:hypothetical protein
MPMRWPAVWRSASLVELLKDSGIDCLIDNRPEIMEVATQAGLQVTPPDRLPENVVALEGVWPGIRSSRFGAAEVSGAGPTGEPWINSNIWPVRLAAARNPGSTVWVRTSPAKAGNTAQPYIMAIADAAMAGGRWVLTLEDELAAGIANGNSAAIDVWRRITPVTRFFSDNREWISYPSEAVLGIFSGFTHPEEKEVLNLVTRSGQQYRVLVKGAAPPDLAGLRAVLYPDKEPVSAHDRAALLAFVAGGGLLIAGPDWGSLPGATRKTPDHPRFNLHTLGSGTVAIAKGPLTDTYLLASDASILLSHRYDLVRFFNGGALQACCSRGLVQVLFYANQPAVDTSLWAAGNWTGATLRTFGAPEPRALKTEAQQGGIEIQLPGAMRFAAIELSRL